MKKNTFILLIVAVSVGMLSCKKELGRVNRNPNNLETADPTTLLSNVLVSEFYSNASAAWTLGNGYSQYMTFSQDYYNTSTRYAPVTNDPYWTAMYENARDANILYNTGVNQKNNLMQAAALTLRSYAFAQLTELWGDIPFTQALQGSSGVYTPAYDQQQTVYTDPTLGIIPSLRRADSLLKASATGILNGDLLYNGNATSWRRFINALRLRYLIRVSAKMNVAPEIQAIVSDGTLIQSDAQSAAIDLPSTLPYNFPSLTERTGDFQVKYLNQTLYNIFQNTGDTGRLKAYFATNATASNTTTFSWSNYGGMPLVVNASAAQQQSSSNFNSNFTTVSNKGVIKARIMTYAEQEFDLAEAALKGYISGDPASYYQNGVIGAYQQVGLSSAQAMAYLSHPSVALSADPTVALSQIITQKYLANIGNGFEGWIEWKRTGYPQLDPGGAANLNNGALPLRFLYPNTETTINSANYNQEVQKMGGKETTTYRAWW